MKTKLAGGIFLALMLASCVTPPPGKVVINDQNRFDEQQKGYQDRESKAYRDAEQAEAQKQSMLTGKVK